MREEGFANPKNEAGEPFRATTGSYRRNHGEMPMCRRTECPDCKKPSYAGCGRHIDQVLGDVPPADRCHCHEKKGSESATPGGVADVLRRFLGV